MRVTMLKLKKHCPDRIREIEMAVDAVVPNQAVSIQFWRDVSLYGLKEAMMYLRGNCPGKDLDALQRFIDVVTAEVESKYHDPERFEAD